MLDGATHMTGDKSPSDGDVGVCIVCGAINTYVVKDGEVSLRKTSDEEIASFPRREREMLITARLIILEHNN